MGSHSQGNKKTRKHSAKAKKVPWYNNMEDEPLGLEEQETDPVSMADVETDTANGPSEIREKICNDPVEETEGHTDVCEDVLVTVPPSVTEIWVETENRVADSAVVVFVHDVGIHVMCHHMLKRPKKMRRSNNIHHVARKTISPQHGSSGHSHMCTSMHYKSQPARYHTLN